jgi:hypothetical protein
MDEHTIAVISLTVGLMSFASAVVFFLLALRSERKNREILDNINKAIQGWHSAMVASNIELLESRPEIVAKRTNLEDTKAKHEFWNNLSERIKYIIEHPASGDESVVQAHKLQLLLDAFKEATKSNVPPELYMSLMHQQSEPQKDKSKENPAQSPNAD